ncbi:MAG: acetolactate decarboxylase [Armatimonadetes bacterium]|nr:acetolactate decarboxylase [Armatimonadota bacterium]
MRSLRCSFLCLSLLLYLGISAQSAPDRDILFQISTFDALMSGLYDGAMTFKELKKHGDFGIGTFDGWTGR